MGDSLQDYFSNLLLGCGGVGIGSAEIVSDNARARPSYTSSSHSTGSRSSSGGGMNLDWLHDCCSADTTINSSYNSGWGGGGGFDLVTAPFCFSRWDSMPTSSPSCREQQRATNRDTPLKRPRRRPLGDGSDNPGDESAVQDYNAVFFPTEDALDGDEPSSSSSAARMANHHHQLPPIRVQ